jgi:hypothetical protein
MYLTYDRGGLYLKKTVAWTLAALLAAAAPWAAFAAEPETSAEANFRSEAPLQEASKAGVDVTLRNGSGAPKTFELTVTVSDLTVWPSEEAPAQYRQAETKTASVSVAANGSETAKLDVSRKGFVKIELAVKTDGMVILQEARELCLFDY